MEGNAQKSDGRLTGRTDTLKRVVFDDIQVRCSLSSPGSEKTSVKPGDYVTVKIASASHSTFVGEPIARTSLQEFTQAPPAEI